MVQCFVLTYFHFLRGNVHPANSLFLPTTLLFLFFNRSTVNFMKNGFLPRRVKLALEGIDGAVTIEVGSLFQYFTTAVGKD